MAYDPACQRATILPEQIMVSFIERKRASCYNLKARQFLASTSVLDGAVVGLAQNNVGAKVGQTQTRVELPPCSSKKTIRCCRQTSSPSAN